MRTRKRKTRKKTVKYQKIVIPLVATIFLCVSIMAIKQIVNNTSSGGVCINDTIMHITEENLPFGGVGNSGMGSYHGKKSFETFTHYKSILNKSNVIDFKFKYPPYKDFIMKFLR